MFFIFMITGFFHAALLQTVALTIVAGVTRRLSSSTSLIGGIPVTAEEWTVWVAIVVVQTIVDRLRHRHR